MPRPAVQSVGRRLTAPNWHCNLCSISGHCCACYYYLNSGMRSDFNYAFEHFQSFADSLRFSLASKGEGGSRAEGKMAYNWNLYDDYCSSLLRFWLSLTTVYLLLIRVQINYTYAQISNFLTHYHYHHHCHYLSCHLFDLILFHLFYFFRLFAVPCFPSKDC